MELDIDNFDMTTVKLAGKQSHVLQRNFCRMPSPSFHPNISFFYFHQVSYMMWGMGLSVICLKVSFYHEFWRVLNGKILLLVFFCIKETCIIMITAIESLKEHSVWALHEVLRS